MSEKKEVKKKEKMMERIGNSVKGMKIQLQKMNKKSNEFMKAHPVTMQTAGHLGSAMIGAVIGYLIGLKQGSKRSKK